MSNPIMTVSDFAVFCRIGCTLDERAVAQKILFSIKIKFKGFPAACETDRLEDAICYADLCSEIEKVAHKNIFQTIERLSFEVFLSLSHFLSPNKVELQLKIKKTQPPIKNLLDGVSFELGGFT